MSTVYIPGSGGQPGSHVFIPQGEGTIYVPGGQSGSHVFIPQGGGTVYVPGSAGHAGTHIFVPPPPFRTK
jgi:hypothetical protein